MTVTDITAVSILKLPHGDYYTEIKCHLDPEAAIMNQKCPLKLLKNLFTAETTGVVVQ
jgi:hypothetical protein